MTWSTTTPLKAGPLGSNSYNFTITGLTEGTNYIYRAYFLVDSVEYYGDILTGTTLSASLVVPTMTTGIATNILSVDFFVTGNTVDNNGGAPILEYGTLHTQIGVAGSPAHMTYTNPNVNIVSTLSNISVGIPYTNTVTGLAEGTLTYYRSFARNALGVGYGSVKTALTETGGT